MHAFVSIMAAIQDRLVAAGTSVGEGVYLDRIDALQTKDAPAFVIEPVDVKIVQVLGETDADRRETYAFTLAVTPVVVSQAGSMIPLWGLVAEAKAALNGVGADLHVDDFEPAGFGPLDRQIKCRDGHLDFVPILFRAQVSLAEGDHTQTL
ncbi:hypothetical protein [Devosia nitrariae]|uniref:DUF3168 domain-containing protein n=1 Tax=Devosia nitrariae TaxID=2071872 RepID=A0ABQ5W147_9HYPH|nr:hypothetical protein [Devosia nitrariae]GLQ53599.1 hypothetical protein GCM10010862_08580 [Devosia nitrariae]